MVGKLPPLYLYIRMHFCSTSPNDSIIITKVINHISFHKVSGHRVSPSRARLDSSTLVCVFVVGCPAAVVDKFNNFSHYLGHFCGLVFV